MTLEQEWWKERRGTAPLPRREGPATAFDRVARFVAIVILLGLGAVTVWALSLSPVTAYLLPAGLILAFVYLASRVHQLDRQLAASQRSVEELRAAVDSLRAAAQAPEPSPAALPAPAVEARDPRPPAP